MIDFDKDYNSIRIKHTPYIPPIKKSLKDSGFFYYFFKHKRKIRKWNQNRYLIRFTSMGINLEPNNEFKEKLDNLFLKHLLKLNSFIDVIIANGWQMKYISIWEYNVIVNFKKFYDQYYQVISNNEVVKEDFFKLERAYVKVSFSEYYSNCIISVFEKFLKFNNRKYEKDKKTIDEILRLLRAFFETDNLAISLKELILTYNMTLYRTYYTWGDIFTRIGEDIVQDKCYNCSLKVFNNIVKYYTNLRKAIDAINAEQIQLLQLKNNCNYETDNPAILLDFYKDLNHNWIIDKKNFYLLFLLTVQGLIDRLDDLIYKNWDLMKENEIHVNQQLIYDNDISTLFNNLKKEHEQAFVLFNEDAGAPVTISEYREQQTPETLCKSDTQNRLFKSFNKILAQIFDISFMFKSYGDIAKETNYKTHTFIRYMIDSPKEWKGKPVFSLFNYYIELSWTICSFYKYKTFRFLDSRLLQIDSELEIMLEEKKRIDRYNIIGKVISAQPKVEDGNIDR